MHSPQSVLQQAVGNGTERNRGKDRELKWAAVVTIGILLAVLCIWLFVKWLSSQDWTFEPASRRAAGTEKKLRQK